MSLTGLHRCFRYSPIYYRSSIQMPVESKGQAIKMMKMEKKGAVNGQISGNVEKIER